MTRNPLTRLDIRLEWVSVEWLSPFYGHWIVMVRAKIDSYCDTYVEAESRWAELTMPLPVFRG